MSNKPVKVTDRSKAWNRKKNISGYRIEILKTRKTILIVTEGQTEKLYFESFPVLTSYKVEAIDLKGQSKLKLIDSTEAIVEDALITYDEIWCVFDMDVKQGEREFSDFDNAIIQGEYRGFKIAYSNDSFELWFYLHYNYNDIQNTRKFYYQELGKYWAMNYEKDGKKRAFCEEIYNRLEEDSQADQESAIHSAEMLHTNQMNAPYHQQNPVTTVHLLVKELNKNLKP